MSSIPVTPKSLSASSRRTPYSRSGKRAPTGRFIPSRSAANMDLQNHEISSLSRTASSSLYDDQLKDTVFNREKETKILSFKPKPPKPEQSVKSHVSELFSTKQKFSEQVCVRHIASNPERILDAPGLLDDYYLNLLDWSSSSVLAVALGQALYLWNSVDGSIELLTEMEGEDYLCSLRWMTGGTHLAVGNSRREVQLWDVTSKKQVRSMHGHVGRVSSLAWNDHILTSGGRDALIINNDVRQAQAKVSTFTGHNQEICGLEWAPDGVQLASGSNDNRACVWDLGRPTSGPKHDLTLHMGAVKALAWSPHSRNLLATGGGTTDRCIRFWNTTSGACVNSIDAKSQVCSLKWNPYDNEILSSHGFADNQLSVWSYPSLKRVADLNGHTQRVLHTAISPDGTTVCSAAADETLRFWKVFEKKNPKKKVRNTKSKRRNLLR